MVLNQKNVTKSVSPLVATFTLFDLMSDILICQSFCLFQITGSSTD